MHFAILGSGAVGQSLARGLRRHGHDITIGTRDPSKLSAFADEHELQVTSSAEAAAAGDIVILCPAWAGAHPICRAIHDNVDGKVVIDVTNPLVATEGMPALLEGAAAGVQVQHWLPGAKVVKAWNIVNNLLMIDPDLPEPPTMFIAGDDADAKATVTGILDEVGWHDTVDIGGIEASRYLEGMAMVWIRTGIQRDHFHFAFRTSQGGR